MRSPNPLTVNSALSIGISLLCDADKGANASAVLSSVFSRSSKISKVAGQPQCKGRLWGPRFMFLFSYVYEIKSETFCKGSYSDCLWKNNGCILSEENGLIGEAWVYIILYFPPFYCFSANAKLFSQPAGLSLFCLWAGRTKVSCLAIDCILLHRFPYETAPKHFSLTAWTGPALHIARRFFPPSVQGVHHNKAVLMKEGSTSPGASTWLEKRCCRVCVSVRVLVCVCVWFQRWSGEVWGICAALLFVGGSCTVFYIYPSISIGPLVRWHLQLWGCCPSGLSIVLLWFHSGDRGFGRLHSNENSFTTPLCVAVVGRPYLSPQTVFFLGALACWGFKLAN